MAVTLLPSAAVDRICHDEQMVIWSGDLVGALSLSECLRDDLSYDDIACLHEVVKREIRSIVRMALDHPEARTIMTTDQVVRMITPSHDGAPMSRVAAIQPRCLSREDAAAYCGCDSLSAFDSWVRKELSPDLSPAPKNGTGSQLTTPLTVSVHLAPQYRPIHTSHGRLSRMQMRVKGIHTVKAKLTDGTKRVYYYAWKGGPRINAEPGTPDFWAAYNKIVATRREHAVGSLGDVIDEYLVSGEFKAVSTSHQRALRSYLELIRKQFGTMPLRVIEDRRVRGDFRKWRDKFIETPRKADYAWTTLSRLMTFAIDRGHISVNPCVGGKRLYDADRADKIWGADDLRAFLEIASVPLQRALMLALWTGQRQGDLLRLTWSAYDGKTIRLKQSKGKARVPVPVGGGV